MYGDDEVRFTLRLQKDLHAELRQIATRENRTLQNWLVTRLRIIAADEREKGTDDAQR